MARKRRYLLNRDGRYFARVVVRKDLRPYLDEPGKSELRTALGPDRRVAEQLLDGAVAELKHRIALAARRAAEARGTPVEPGGYPLAPEQIARINYETRIALDLQMRRMFPSYARIGLDDQRAGMLREGMAGRLTNEQLAELVGEQIETFRGRGNTTAEFGSEGWWLLARALCVSEYEAMARMAERDEGDFSGTPSDPVLSSTQMPEDEPAPVPLRTLFRDYVASRQQIGKGREIERRWTPVIEDLCKFVRHSDARRLTKKDVMAWRDARIQTLSPKTVSGVYLAALRSVLNWAVENDRLAENVAENVRQEAPRKVRNREKGFTTCEAVAILRAAQGHRPKQTGNPRTTEAPTTTMARRWAPWICAFTGARIGEVTQLRKEDFRKEGDALVMRIRPEAGTTKTDEWRDVPLHPQLIEMGFWQVVESADGPLFYPSERKDRPVAASQSAARAVAKWLHAQKLVPAGVSPNHGWRHRFKTVGREVGISDLVLDAITGHAGKTAGDRYGDVTITTRKAAIDRLPFYEVAEEAPRAA